MYFSIFLALFIFVYRRFRDTAQYQFFHVAVDVLLARKKKTQKSFSNKMKDSFGGLPYNGCWRCMHLFQVVSVYTRMDTGFSVYQIPLLKIKTGLSNIISLLLGAPLVWGNLLTFRIFLRKIITICKKSPLDIIYLTFICITLIKSCRTADYSEICKHL